MINRFVYYRARLLLMVSVGTLISILFLSIGMAQVPDEEDLAIINQVKRYLITEDLESARAYLLGALLKREKSPLVRAIALNVVNRLNRQAVAEDDPINLYFTALTLNQVEPDLRIKNQLMAALVRLEEYHEALLIGDELLKEIRTDRELAGVKARYAYSLKQIGRDIQARQMISEALELSEDIELVRRYAEEMGVETTLPPSQSTQLPAAAVETPERPVPVEQLLTNSVTLSVSTIDSVDSDPVSVSVEESEIETDQSVAEVNPDLTEQEAVEEQEEEVKEEFERPLLPVEMEQGQLFSSYRQQRERRLKIFATATLVILLILFLYLVRPFGDSLSSMVINKRSAIKSGDKLFRKGRWIDAAAEYEKIVNLGLIPEEFIHVSLNLARCYFNARNYSSAIINLRKLIRKSPANLDAYKLLGEIYVLLKDRTVKALEVFRYLFHKKAATDLMEEILLSDMMIKNNYSFEAEAVCRSILKRDLDNGTALRHLAKINYHNDKFDDKTLKLLRRAIQVNLKDQNLKQLLIQTLFKRREYEQVVVESKFLIQEVPDNLIAHSLLIDSMVRLEQRDELVREYETLANRFSGSAVTVYIHRSLYRLYEEQLPLYEGWAEENSMEFTLCNNCSHINLLEYQKCQRCLRTIKV